MTSFVSSSCQVIGDTAISNLAWDNSQQILALSAFTIDDNEKETNQIFFSNTEGELLPTADFTHDYEALVFSWHPTEKFLAVGWADGMVSIWNVDGKNKPNISFVNSSQHHSNITVLKWNPNGKRLVSGDKKGLVCVWSADNRGILSLLRQYRKKGEIMDLCYCLLTPKFNQDNNQISLKSKSEIKTSNYSPPFFFGTDRGVLVFADDLGHCSDVHQLSSSIDSVMFFEEKSRLIIVTRSLLLTQYHVADDGKITRVMQVKLSVSSDLSERGIGSIAWAGPGLLAAATEEKVIRFFDVAADESYSISMSSALGGYFDRSDRVVSTAFSSIDRYLAVGTQSGIVAIWKYIGGYRDLSNNKVPSATSTNDWELVYRSSLNSPILKMEWYKGRGCLAVVAEDDTIILNESILNSYAVGDLAVLQENPNEVLVRLGNQNGIVRVNTGIQIKGISVSRSCFIIWNNKAAKIYRADPTSNKVEGLDVIKTSSGAIAIADSSYIVEEAWFSTDYGLVRINNFKGTQKGALTFSEAEGSPLHLDINGKYLAVATDKGCIKIIDVTTPTKPKQVGSSGFFTLNKGESLSTDFPNIKIKSIKVNSSGTMVAILCDQVEGQQKIYYPDSKLYFYDRLKGGVVYHDFSSNFLYPISIFWDETDERLCSCETDKIKDSKSVDPPKATKTDQSEGKYADENDNVEKEDASNSSNTQVFIFFATSDHGILMQDSFFLERGYGSLIGLSVPNLYFRKSLNQYSHKSNDNDLNEKDINPDDIIIIKIMRDFVGLKTVNETIKSSLLDFSFYLTLGKLDEAYRVVKEINSPTIWENMAQMCVKTKRLDVAKICLGNMGHARGAAAVRESQKENSLEVSLGILAIQLGLLDDAANLFKEANRYDLLNKLYQNSGLWEKALFIASSKDRIHMKTTHYQYAKYLESAGKIDEAISQYELSENSRTEIPRMLFNNNRIEELGEYVMKSDDSMLLKWWAAYLESIDRLDKAKKYYNKAKDYQSLVRIFCFQGDLQKAAEIVSETADRASAYHFARQLENQGEFQEAINFYALSGCYNHSIRLAKAYSLDAELMRYAAKTTPALMIECAQHFESKGELDKAIQLYYKGNDIPRAMELCFRVGEEPKNKHAAVAFDMLNTIARELGSESSPQTLARCADFLVQHKQYDKAIELYVMAKRFHAAVEMCLQFRVNINDSMVEKLTPPDTMDAAERKEILTDLAKALKKQGAFTLASKKYTQAGDRVKAIQCLVRSGDTKAVIQFATISRNSEIYTLAANYLQQMNWRESMDIMKAIITFYTKAKAFVQLAGFYDSCAQVEIDEYKDYEKAISALQEALKHLSKDNSRTAADMSSHIEKKIHIIEIFLDAKKLFRSSPEKAISEYENLLNDPMTEDAIRVGDIISIIIEFYHKDGNMKEVVRFYKELEIRNIQPNLYLENYILQDIDKFTGKPKVNSRSQEEKEPESRPAAIKRENSDEIDEEIDEELEEEDPSPVKNRNQRYGRK